MIAAAIKALKERGGSSRAAILKYVLANNKQLSTNTIPLRTPVADKVKAAAKKAEHPPYAVMIAAAIKALKERGGSSRAAILKYVLANNKIADAAKAQVRYKLATQVPYHYNTLPMLS